MPFNRAQTAIKTPLQRGRDKLLSSQKQVRRNGKKEPKACWRQWNESRQSGFKWNMALHITTPCKIQKWGWLHSLVIISQFVNLETALFCIAVPPWQTYEELPYLNCKKTQIDQIKHPCCYLALIHSSLSMMEHIHSLKHDLTVRLVYFYWIK